MPTVASASDVTADWGLYVTERGKPEVPPRFTEPAIFIVGPDGKLDHGPIDTAQRRCPDPNEILAHIADRVAEAAA